MFSICYITAKDKKEAEKIISALLEKRLIACANMFSVKSQYWWKGKIEKSSEYAIIAKTRKEKEKEIIKVVKGIHSYEVPCIVFSEITGSKDFLDWIEKEIR